MDIGKLKLTVDSSDVDKAAKKIEGLGDVASSAVSKFATVAKGVTLVGTAALAAVTGLIALARSVADAADALNDLSVRTNISTERLSLLDAVVKTAGSSVEELVASSERLAMKLSRQDQESGKVVTALRELGVSTKNAAGETKSMLQLQEDIVVAAEKATNQSKAQGLAVQALGQEYYKLRGPIKEVIEKKKEMYEYMKNVGALVTEDLAKQSDELNDKLFKLGLAFKGMAITVSKLVLPILNNVGDQLLFIMEGAAAIVRKYGGGRTNNERAEDALQGLQQRLSQQEATLERAQEAARRSGSADDEKLVKRVQAQVDKLKEAVREMQRLKTATASASTAADQLVLGGKLDEGINPEGDTYETDRKAEAEAKKAAADRQRLLDLDKAGWVKFIDDKIAEEERLDEMLRKIDEDRSKFEADMLKKDLEGWVAYADAVVEADFQAAQQLAQIQSKQAEEHFNTMQKVAEQAFQSIGNALMDFVVQGEFNFKKFLAAFLRGIAQMILQITILTPMMEALKKSFSSSGGGWGTLLTNVVGAFAGGKAAGGPVGAGKTYLVGEKGPELFSPSKSGMIVPNHQLSSGGGGVNVGTINISVQGGESNEETGQAVNKAVMDAMKAIARTEIASSRRVGGILNPV